jgi:hypothetical protein
MSTTDIQIEQLLFKLKGLEDPTLLQRVTDFIDGIIAARQSDDWWDELSNQDKVDLKESIADGEAGREKSMEEVFKKYGR